MYVCYYAHITDILQVADNTWNQDFYRPRASLLRESWSSISAIVSDNKVYTFLNRRNNPHNGNSTKCSCMRHCKTSTYFVDRVPVPLFYYWATLSVDLLYVPQKPDIALVQDAPSIKSVLVFPHTWKLHPALWYSLFLVR